MPLDLAIPRADTCRTVQDAAGLLVELGDEIAFAPIVVGHVSAGRDLPGRQCEARLVPFDRQHDPQGAEPLADSSADFLVRPQQLLKETARLPLEAVSPEQIGRANV